MAYLLRVVVFTILSTLCGLAPSLGTCRSLRWDGSSESKPIFVLEEVPLFVPHGEEMLDLFAAKKHDAAAEERMTGEVDTCHMAVLDLTTVEVSDAACDEILNRGVEIHGEAEIGEAKLAPDMAEGRDGNGVRIEEERRLPTELVDLRFVVRLEKLSAAGGTSMNSQSSRRKAGRSMLLTTRTGPEEPRRRRCQRLRSTNSA
jgi:hypothetical protein